MGAPLYFVLFLIICALIAGWWHTPREARETIVEAVRDNTPLLAIAAIVVLVILIT